MVITSVQRHNLYNQRKNNRMMEFLWKKPCSEIENYVKSLGIEINTENLDNFQNRIIAKFPMSK